MCDARLDVLELTLFARLRLLFGSQSLEQPQFRAEALTGPSSRALPETMTEMPPERWRHQDVILRDRAMRVKYGMLSIIDIM